MIKHDHENESSQTMLTKDKSESHFSDHISHFETRRKDVINIFSQQLVSIFITASKISSERAH